MLEFKTKLAEHLDKLVLYVPVVARVHGESHPEFFKVQEQFDLLQEKLAAPDQAQLADEFAKLRQITADYTVPADVCDSYAAVYQMLAELDQAYHLAKKKN